VLTQRTSSSSPAALPALAPAPSALPPRSSSSSSSSSVGRLGITLVRKGVGVGRWGEVTLVVRGEPSVTLEGVVVREPRPGFLTLELPPLEDWAAALSFVDDAVRERFEQAEFYEALRGAIAERWVREDVNAVPGSAAEQPRGRERTGPPAPRPADGPGPSTSRWHRPC
jgi:hypothetical protein